MNLSPIFKSEDKNVERLINWPKITELVNGDTDKGPRAESILLATVLSKFLVNSKCHVKVIVVY